jgi:Flp pilus assembly protein TadD
MCSDFFRTHARTNVLIAVIVAMTAASLPASSSGQESAPPVQNTPAETHVGQGYEALKQENYDAATNEFRAALALDPTLGSRARMPLAIALFESHHPTEAKQELETVRQQSGPNPSVSYYLGRLDLEQNKFGSAIQNLTKAMSKPPFPDTAYYLGFGYFKNGNLPAAEKWLTEAAKANPADSRVQYQLGMIYRKQGRPEEARKALTRSKELRDTEDSRSKLSTECAQKLEQGSLEAARSVCDQLYDPDDSKKLTVLGTIYGQHGHLEEALKPLRRAAELEPQSPQMQYNLAYTYYQLNQLESARAPLAKALQRWPDLFQLNSLYGAVLLRLGEDAEGYRALSHAHDLNPQDAPTSDFLYRAALELAKKTSRLRKYDEALHYLQDAAKIKPQDPEPHLRMAEVYGLMQNPAQASAEQQQAERLEKSAPNR